VIAAIASSSAVACAASRRAFICAATASRAATTASGGLDLGVQEKDVVEEPAHVAFERHLLRVERGARRGLVRLRGRHARVDLAGPRDRHPDRRALAGLAREDLIEPQVLDLKLRVREPPCDVDERGGGVGPAPRAPRASRCGPSRARRRRRR
jgi:hypothetical protein